MTRKMHVLCPREDTTAIKTALLRGEKPHLDEQNQAPMLSETGKAVQLLENSNVIIHKRRW